MKKILNILFTFVMLVVFNIGTVASFVRAQDADFVAGKSLVPCGNDKEVETDSAGVVRTIPGTVKNPCGFDDFFLFLNRLIEYVFKLLVVPIAAIMFAYAGFLMLFSGGNAGASEKAKGIFINVAYGLVIAAGAWLIINTLLNIVGFNGTAFGLEKKQNL